MKLYIRIGDMYLQRISVDVNYSDTEFIESLEFCSDRSDILDSATFNNGIKAKAVISKIATIFNIDREDIIVVSEKSDFNE